MRSKLRALVHPVAERLARLRPERYDVVFYVPAVGPMLARSGASPAGGAETQALLLAKALARRGYRVAMIAFGDRDELHAQVDGVHILPRWPYRSRAGVVGGIIEALRIWQSLWGAPSRTVVTRCAGPRAGLIAAYARLTGRRAVYASAALLDFKSRRLLPSRRDQLLYILGLRLADEIVVQTEEQVEACRAAIGRRPVLIKSIVSSPGTSNGDAPDAFLWVGRYDALKRPLEYVELARAVPEARFVMVASPQDRELEKAVVAASEETPNLELLPPRSRANMDELMSHAVAAVNTSEAEGMPNALLEAWSAGVPALVLNHDPDGVITTYRLGGFARGSRDTMAELARLQWQRRANRREIAEHCRAYVAEHHSPLGVSRAWCQILGLESSGPADQAPEKTSEP